MKPKFRFHQTPWNLKELTVRQQRSRVATPGTPTDVPRWELRRILSVQRSRLPVLIAAALRVGVIPRAAPMYSALIWLL